MSPRRLVMNDTPDELRKALIDSAGAPAPDDFDQRPPEDQVQAAKLARLSTFAEKVNAATAAEDAKGATPANASIVEGRVEHRDFPAGQFDTTYAITALRESPFNTRRNFGELDELAASILKVGILQPLLVRPRQDHHEIVFGHRRFRAAQKAGLERVPVEVRDLSDSEVVEAQAIENVQRENLHPMEEAEACEHLRKTAGFSPATIAEKLGKSRAWVFARLKLLELGPEARSAFLSGRLPSSETALRLARVPHLLQAKALAIIAPSKGPGVSVREATALLQRDFCRHLRQAPFDLKDEMLQTAAGSCAKCPKNSRNAPELFSDFDREAAGGAAGVCSDVACYQTKLEAHARAQAAALVAQGAKVPAEREKPIFFPDGGLINGSPWVELNTPVAMDAKRRTWAQLIDKMPVAERPQVYVGSSPAGAVALFKRTEATAAAAQLGHAFAKSEAKLDAATERDKKKNAKARAEKKVRSAVVSQVAAAIGEQVEALKAVTVRELRWFAIAYCQTRTLDAVLARRELPEPKLFDWIAKADPRELAGFLAEAVADELGAGAWEDYPETFVEMAASYRLDVEKLEEKHLQDTPKPEPKKKGKK